MYCCVAFRPSESGRIKKYGSRLRRMGPPCLQLNNAEIPMFDGSSAEFVKAREPVAIFDEYTHDRDANSHSILTFDESLETKPIDCYFDSFD